MTAASFRIPPSCDVEGIRVELDHAARQRGVESCDAVQAHLHEFDRRELQAAEHAIQLGRRELRELRKWSQALALGVLGVAHVERAEESGGLEGEEARRRDV